MGKVPEATVERLAKYYHILRHMKHDGIENAKSTDLILGRGLNASQVRKDISHCDVTGERGHGYNTGDLLEAIRKTLGLGRDRNVCVVGMGVCGLIFSRHAWLEKHGFPVVAIFDRDPEKIGLEVGDLTIQSMHDLAEEVERRNIEIGIVATDYAGGQDAADSLVSAGVRAMASFSDANLIIPEGVHTRYAGVFLELTKFSCYLNIKQHMGKEVPESSVERLARYYRILVYLERSGVDVVTSMELGSGAGTNPLQVRKDIGYCGSCGNRGRGYDVSFLREVIRGALGLDRQWNYGIIGASTIGVGTIYHKWFQDRGFPARAIFDCDPNKIGQEAGHLVIHPMEDIKKVVREENIAIGLVTTPPQAAQEATDIWIDAGVRAIFNMTEASVGVPEDIIVRDMNLFTMMCTLSSHLASLAETET